MKKGRRTAGHPAHRDLTREHLTVLKQFESWLAQSDEIAAPTPAEESAFFVGVLLLGQQMRLNLRRPTDVEEIIEFLLDRDDEADEDQGTQRDADDQPRDAAATDAEPAYAKQDGAIEPCAPDAGRLPGQLG